MATLVLMPQKGLSEESAILSRWYVKKGDTVKTGDYLFAIETGKATFDVESEVSGIVLDTMGSEGDEILIKTVMCVVGEPGESYTAEAGTAPAAIPEEQKAAAPVFAPEEQKTGNTMPAASKGQEDGGRIKISPRAMALAKKMNVDISAVKGTGPKGRIVEDDIRGAEQAPVMQKNEPAVLPVAPVTACDGEFTIVKNSAIRKAIAKNMHASLSGTAQLTMNASFDATKILAYREKAKASGEGSGFRGITIGDMIIFAVAGTLMDFPALNAHYNENETTLFQNASIGVAVDTERGLMVPTVTNANLRSLGNISRTVAELAKSCRDGTITPEQMSGATFTISNLGAFGITSFTPVINPPQVAILGVGTVEYKRKPSSSGMVDYPAITLSLTIDHRALDGAPGARFLQTLGRNLEDFTLFLAR